MRRIVSVWLKRWPIARFLRAQASHPSPADPVDPERPFILAKDASGGPVIAALSAAAEEAGLRLGDRVANARAKAEGLQVRSTHPGADQAALRRLALWAIRYTPAVSVWGPENGADGFFLDVTGAAHLFGGERTLIGDIERRLTSFGLEPKLAIADNAGAAWAFSHFQTEPTILDEALASLPIEALRLAPDTAATLRRLGFKRVGAVIDKSRAPFAARFEKELLLRLDQALGRAAEPLFFISPPPIHSSLRRLLEPIVTEEAILHVTRRLMTDLVPGLLRQGQGARRLTLHLFRVDGEAVALNLGTALPTRDPAHVAHLVSLKLERLKIMADAGFGFEALRLTVTATETIEARQDDLASAGTEREAIERESLLLDGIGERLGGERIGHFEPRESHVPERAEAIRLGARKPCEWRPETRPRPLVLLPCAEEAQVTALLPEGPPKRFRWRGASHGVAHWEGPERIADEWWRKPESDRDYYLVEDEGGHRFWLYRERASDGAPRWFVHGLFG
jgi:protein ImuB